MWSYRLAHHRYIFADQACFTNANLVGDVQIDRAGKGGADWIWSHFWMPAKLDLQRFTANCQPNSVRASRKPANQIAKRGLTYPSASQIQTYRPVTVGDRRSEDGGGVSTSTPAAYITPILYMDDGEERRKSAEQTCKYHRLNLRGFEALFKGAHFRKPVSSVPFVRSSSIFNQSSFIYLIVFFPEQSRTHKIKPKSALPPWFWSGAVLGSPGSS